jgi:hypothetical protein
LLRSLLVKQRRSHIRFAKSQLAKKIRHEERRVARVQDVQDVENVQAFTDIPNRLERLEHAKARVVHFVVRICFANQQGTAS